MLKNRKKNCKLLITYTKGTVKSEMLYYVMDEKVQR